MSLPTTVKIVEVAARDGLQNEPENIPTAIKLEFMKKLAASGLKTIEATSFVYTPKIPQLADNSQVMQQLDRQPGIKYPVLVPNMTGLNNALKVNAQDIAVFASASESFSKHNINCSIAESIERFTDVINTAKQHNINIRGYISCVMGCPYEGDIELPIVAKLAKTLYELGCYEISLGDTVGVGTPNQATRLIQAVNQHVPIEAIAVHFHDTYGQALTNIYAALQLGVSIVDSSVTGLGGCPYAKGAAGNVATEEVLYMLNGLGIDTGVDFAKLMVAGKFICNHLQRPPVSKLAKAYFATHDM